MEDLKSGKGDGWLTGAGRFFPVGLVTRRTKPRVFVPPIEITVTLPIAVDYKDLSLGLGLVMFCNWSGARESGIPAL